MDGWHDWGGPAAFVLLVMKISFDTVTAVLRRRNGGGLHSKIDILLDRTKDLR